MGEWLRAQGMPPRAIERFWRPILVSALNEEPGQAAALWGFQVFREGFLADRRGGELGVPAVPLAQLYDVALQEGFGPAVHLHLRSPVERLAGWDREADFLVLALPFERAREVAPEIVGPLDRFEHSPITGIHLWFDRPITRLPHAVLLDGTLQWIFRKSESYYLAVVSASRDLIPASRRQIVEMALRELRGFFPESSQARLLRSHVIKEVRATFSPAPGLQSCRPDQTTAHPRILVAGDWTNTGWPPTMEGAVRSGYLAAEAVARAAGQPARFVLS
jgi:zeta-carotene desaturase